MMDDSTEGVCICGLSLEDIPLLKHAEKCICPGCTKAERAVEEHLGGDDFKLVVSAMIVKFFNAELIQRIRQEMLKDGPLTPEKYGSVFSDTLRGVTIGITASIANLTTSLVKSPRTRFAAQRVLIGGLNEAFLDVLAKEADGVFIQGRNEGVEVTTESFNEFLVEKGFRAEVVTLKELDEKQTTH